MSRKKKKQSIKNPEAYNVRTRRFRSKVVQSKKLYNRSNNDKLCPRGKAAAKRKFKVYPSAYANAYASKICAGKIKDPSGVKRKDFKGPKPAGKAKGGIIDTTKFTYV